jgi:hypothetical protein
MSKLNLIAVSLIVSGSMGGILLADRSANAQFLAHHEHGKTLERPDWNKDSPPELTGLEIFIAPCYDPKSEIILQITPENGGFRVDNFRQVQTQ